MSELLPTKSSAVMSNELEMEREAQAGLSTVIYLREWNFCRDSSAPRLTTRPALSGVSKFGDAFAEMVPRWRLKKSVLL